MREVMITSEKPFFFEGYPWFKFNTFGLALGMALKFYASLAKDVKLKSQNVLRTNSYV